MNPAAIWIVDDDDISRIKLKALLTKRGLNVNALSRGDEAWDQLSQAQGPQLAVLDWMMPGLDGVEVCKRVRAAVHLPATYLILLTARASKGNIIEGLEAGANDYMTKPFDADELYARIQVGLTMLRLQTELADRVKELESAVARINLLQGLLPICAYCKKIRDDNNYWSEVESYISKHADVSFSHGICPDCFKKAVQEAELSMPAGR